MTAGTDRASLTRLQEDLLRAALAMAGVEVLLLPPTAVLLHDATAVLDRQVPMTCAVRGGAVAAAMRCLGGTGWRTDARLPRWLLGGYVLGADRLAWQNGSGETLELLWQRDPGDRSSRFPDEVWARAGRARFANEPVLAMDAPDALHVLCRQPVGGNAFGRIVDLLLLARWRLPALGRLSLGLWRGLRCEWRDSRRSR